MNIHRGLGLAVALTAVLIIGMPVAWADRDHDGHGHWRQDGHGRGYGDGISHRDDHDRRYPRHGANPPIAHRGNWFALHRGINYYFSAGIWYRPLGPRLVVVAPPIGLVVPVPPPYAITVWVDGLTYYYAGGVYYVWSPYRHGYVTSVKPFYK